jgi:hypothetical protein
MYKQQGIRESLKNEFSTIDDYLSSLGLKINVYIDDKSIISRMSQMSQKTNQFNLTTKRYTEKDIENFIDSLNTKVFAWSVSDKFGDNGITGLCIIKLESNSQKAEIDNLQSKDKLKLEVFVKESNKENLTLVINENWPEIIETTYNVWKNEKGNIVKIGEFPFSESGDWEIEYEHYFDQNEKTYAFERNTNFFNNLCAEGVAYEKIIEFYNLDFNKVGRNYSLTDKNKTKLKKENCEMNYDFPFEIYNILKNYLNKINYAG